MKLGHEILNTIKLGASGSGTTQGSVDFLSATIGLGHVTMNGTISSPGSLR